MYLMKKINYIPKYTRAGGKGEDGGGVAWTTVEWSTVGYVAVGNTDEGKGGDYDVRLVHFTCSPFSKNLETTNPRTIFYKKTLDAPRQETLLTTNA